MDFKLTTQNFGIVKHADINVKPLTIFNGANSSGKSFIARLIYLFNSINVSDIHKDISQSFGRDFKYFSEDYKKRFDELSNKISDYFKLNINNELNEFKIPISEFNDLIAEGISKYYSLIFEELLEEQFKENIDDLINFDESFFEINLNDICLYKEYQKPLKVFFNKIKLDDIIYTSEKDKTIIIQVYIDKKFIKLSIKPFKINQNVFDDFESIFSVVYSTIADSIVERFHDLNSYYIPAERSEIIMDKKTLARRVKNESDLSKNQSEVLSNIIKINSSNKGYFYDLACNFEREFSGIEVDVNEENFINEIIYTHSNSGKNISSNLLSTSIYEMTIFSLYLKYILKKGDLLIIEEPEAHLHPENQLLLIKYIVKAVNKGLNVILTSHSEYISDQLNNIVRLNNIPEEKLSQFNYKKEDILNIDDLSIYTFKKESNNSFSTEIVNINSTGFFEKNFTPIVDKLYKESINIINGNERW